jgi:hypothetical protein
LVVGVGIEPTFRAFQTRANPSQLSDRNGGIWPWDLGLLYLELCALCFVLRPFSETSSQKNKGSKF